MPEGGVLERIAVMAAGAVGGYFGGRMAAAGHDVAFIARGAHRDAIRRDGLKIESALGDLHLKTIWSPFACAKRSKASRWA
jgi:2-dehydropantoate 2-reductase